MQAKLKALLLSVVLATGLGTATTSIAKDSFLNVSYDPTREFYQEINQSFAIYWKNRTGQAIDFKQSHSGSGKQARSVVDGLDADVVTLALAYDIDMIANAGKIAKDWQQKFPHNSSPYTSTIVFVVRKGNPKQIKDWNDLTRQGVELITANPKTSGGARWVYLAAWAYALQQPNANSQTAQDFVKQLFGNVSVMDTGARGATTTFMERKIGDVLLAWENEALMTLKNSPQGEYEIIYPSVSILAEPPVAVVDKNVQKNGHQWLATGYLNFLYSPYAQDLAAKHYYRPRNEQVLAKYKAQFPDLKLLTVNDIFGSWQKAHQTHFANGGVFDQIYQPKK